MYSLSMTTAESTTPVRLALLDDHRLLLDGMSTWIADNAPGFDVVLASSSWADFVSSSAFPGDLVFLDYQLKEGVSIESRVRTCRAAGAKVIVVSGLNTRQTRTRSLGAGASAFLSKDLPMPEIISFAQDIMGIATTDTHSRTSEGQIGPETAEPEPLPSAAHEKISRVVPKLSDGEKEALALYASGLSIAEVAEQMSVQYETAKTYIRRVREKYNKAERPAGTRAELIRRAAEDGFLR